MPYKIQDTITSQQKSAVSVAFEPAHVAVHTLSLITKCDQMPDLDPWISRVAASLSPERMRQHRLVFIGVYYAVLPTQSWPSFMAFVDDLAKQDPHLIKDRLFAAYESFPILTGRDTPPPFDEARLLASRDAYLDYLRDRFTPDHIEEDIETEIHALLNNLPALQNLMVSYLRTMWVEVLAPEWERVAPMLQTSVLAFQQSNYRQMPILDAARFIAGQEPNEVWSQSLQKAERVIFIPTSYIGPYVGKFKTGRTLWVFFGARLPQDAQIYAPDLARSELLTRLTALADDTRLRILYLLAEQGEMCSPDIVRQLALSQPVASRHLQQLSAAGYVRERRRDTAKCYSLNPDRVDETFQSLNRFLRNARHQLVSSPSQPGGAA
jgi:ArsR family transcriptional regulator